MRKVGIVGAGITPCKGRWVEKTYYGLSQMAVKTCLEDAAMRSVKDPEAGWRKAENIREVITALATFEQQEPQAGLGDYLVGVNLSGRDEEDPDSPSEAVTLLTVHSAKGLEFPRVFLVGLEEDLFPHERSGAVPGGMEEERRLAYVGMTRAKRNLTLTHAVGRSRWSKETVCTPSRFLDELPEEGIEREDRRGGEGEEEVDLIEEDRIAEEYIKRIRSRF